MKKLLAILMVTVLMHLVIVASLLAEDTKESEESLLFMEIPNVIGVSKADEKLSEVPMAVYNVNQAELDRWGARSLDEVFQRVPGFSFYNTDYYGQYGAIGRGLSSIWRYGCSFELMPLVDFGHLVMSPKWFKDIEIARGPAGLMWGSSAEAGLINFNLRDDLEGTEFSGEYGDYSRQSMDFMYGHTDPNNKNNTMFFGYHEESQDPQIYTGALAGMGQASNDWKSNGINPSESFVAKIQQDRIKVIFLVLFV